MGKKEDIEVKTGSGASDGIGCFFILIGLAIFTSFPAILKLIELAIKSP